MNEKLQRTYYIIGIIQRIGMIILTLAMIGAAYKIYDLSVKSFALIQQYGVDIQRLYILVETMKRMLEKSFFF
jgi:hypothetical protein